MDKALAAAGLHPATGGNGLSERYCVVAQSLRQPTFSLSRRA